MREREKKNIPVLLYTCGLFSQLIPNPSLVIFKGLEYFAFPLTVFRYCTAEASGIKARALLEFGFDKVTEKGQKLGNKQQLKINICAATCMDF